MAGNMTFVWSMASQTTTRFLWWFGVHPKTVISEDVHSKSTMTSAGDSGPTYGAPLISYAPWNGTKRGRVLMRLRFPGIFIAVVLLGSALGWWERMGFISAMMKWIGKENFHGISFHGSSVQAIYPGFCNANWAMLNLYEVDQISYWL